MNLRERNNSLATGQSLGKLIVLEGCDDVGKSTIAKQIAERSKNKCVVVSFPGQELGSLGEWVYDLHHASKTKSIDPTSLQLLHIAAHIECINSQIKPLLAAGCIVVLDRFWWSTWAYGIVSGVDQPSLKKMINIELGFWADRKPSCVILIRRENTERSELAKSLVHEYEKLGKKEHRKYPVYQVSNDGTIDESVSLIFERLRDLGLRFSASRNNKPIQKSLLDNGNGKFSKKKTNDLAPLVPTVVYDTYWRFAFLRQEIFFRRFAGETVSLTSDPVLSQYKFTNPYRAADRVSQYLIRNVIYKGDRSINEVFFRTLLFKLFNRISTWELFRDVVGNVELKTYTFKKYDEILTRAIEKGERIYSAAYIMPSGGRNSDYDRKHRMHLKLLEQMIEDELPEKLSNCNSMGDAFLLLRAYPTLGDFLAYQYVTDVNYSEITNFTEMEFVVAGPGARNGIRKCFGNLGGLNDAEIIRLVTERQDVEFEARGLKFPSLFGRKLQLIDCQNLFCEVDKYARVMHPEFSGTNTRKRIKQKFHLNSEPIDYWFPPKWNINENIEKRVENYARI